MSSSENVERGVTVPTGFLASGVHAGIKVKNFDLAVLLSESPATVAGTFTTNKIQGATVRLCRDRLAGGVARAVVINSGNANACTGAKGLEDAEEMAVVAATQLELNPAEVFVCSTGCIGIPLPMDKVVPGIVQACGALSSEGGDAAAKAIMTTDTVDKQVGAVIEAGGTQIRIGGMAKGAGMIEPNMATMLAFLTTDAAVEQTALQACLSAAVDDSFNRISVDGDQSCNDTVLLLANGGAGNDLLSEDHPDWDVFCGAVGEAAHALAQAIVRDGEGATKFVTVVVKGAASINDAKVAARAIANSLLVKTSWFGCDPNWGRVIDAVGYSGAEVKETLVEISYDEVCAVRNGCKAEETALAELERVLRQDRFAVTVDLNLGDEIDTVYTCDCSEEYVRINSEYMT